MCKSNPNHSTFYLSLSIPSTKEASEQGNSGATQKKKKLIQAKSEEKHRGSLRKSRDGAHQKRKFNQTPQLHLSLRKSPHRRNRNIGWPLVIHTLTVDVNGVSRRPRLRINKPFTPLTTPPKPPFPSRSEPTTIFTTTAPTVPPRRIHPTP